MRIILALLLSASTLFAQKTYWVNADCTSSGTGLTQVEALQTLQEAYALVNVATDAPGSNILLYTGVYNFAAGSDSLKAQATLTNPITIKGIEEGVVITKADFSHNAMCIYGAKNIVFEAIDFSNAAGGDARRSGTMEIVDAENITWNSCSFYGKSGTDTGGWINIQDGDYFDFTGNTWGSGGSACDSEFLKVAGSVTQVIFNHNTIWGLSHARTSGQNVIEDITANDTQWVITNNIAYNLNLGSGVNVFQVEWGDDSNYISHHNAAHTLTSGGFAGGTGYTSGEEGTLYADEPTFIDRGGNYYKWTLAPSNPLTTASDRMTALGGVPSTSVLFGSSN